MKWQRTLAWVLALVLVPVTFLLIMLAYSPNKAVVQAPVVESPVVVQDVSVADAKAPGDLIMLDPQGDLELAKQVVKQGVETGPSEIILSRKVLGGHLPCVGLESFPGLENRATELFGVVVLRADLPPFPGDRVYRTMTTTLSTLIYDTKTQRITARSGPDWPYLRAAFGGPHWPLSSPMYVSPDGQPSLTDDVRNYFSSSRLTAKPQEMQVSQTINGWTVTVVRVLAQGDRVAVGYTVVGPRQRYNVDKPTIEANGKTLRSGYDALERSDTIGPRVGVISFSELPTAEQPQEITLRFMVPAIHVRPGRYNCETPSLKVEDYPTPTPIPNDLPHPISPTSEPDLDTIGPFTLDLKVQVEPAPTQPPIPTPVPTSTYPPGFFPSPQPTGQP
jgi:hypothetical protein